MKPVLTVFLLVLGINSFSQPITILTHDGKVVNSTITASSTSTLFTMHGSFQLSTIDTVSFEVKHTMDKRLYDKLEAAGVNLKFTGVKIVSDAPSPKEEKAGEKFEKPFKGANTIIFKTKISDDSLYTLIGRKLVASGFSIDVNNREFLQLRTSERYLDASLTYLMTISVANKEVSVRIATIRYYSVRMTSPTQRSESEWHYNPSRAFIFYKVHDDVIELLSDLGKVYYAKK